jgi:hypothetical protein
MRIALDAMGGDHAPRNMIAGAQLAMAELPRIDTLFLVGDESRIKSEMQALGFHDPRIEIVHTTEVVDMHDSAVKAIRQKKEQLHLRRHRSRQTRPRPGRRQRRPHRRSRRRRHRQTPHTPRHRTRRHRHSLP